MPGGPKTTCSGRANGPKSPMDTNRWPPGPTCSSSRSSACPEPAGRSAPATKCIGGGPALWHFWLRPRVLGSGDSEIVGCGSAAS